MSVTDGADTVALLAVLHGLDSRGGAEDGYELASGLSRRTYNIARLAASLAAGPSPAARVDAALARGLPAEDVLGVLAAVAPEVTPERLMAAAAVIRDVLVEDDLE